MTTQTVSGRRYFTKAWLMEQKSLIALLVLIAIVSTLSPNFFTINNLFNILQQTSVNAIMAVGMTLVILTSGIDLSVGSLLALTGAVAASIVGIEVNALVAVAAALALGAAIGAVTGVIVAKGRVQAFIATLVMMLLLRGVTMVYTNGSPVNTGFTENARSVWLVWYWSSAGRTDASLDHGYCLPRGLVHAASHAFGALHLRAGRQRSGNASFWYQRQ